MLFLDYAAAVKDLLSHALLNDMVISPLNKVGLVM